MLRPTAKGASINDIFGNSFKGIIIAIAVGATVEWKTYHLVHEVETNTTLGTVCTNEQITTRNKVTQEEGLPLT